MKIAFSFFFFFDFLVLFSYFILFNFFFVELIVINFYWLEFALSEQRLWDGNRFWHWFGWNNKNTYIHIHLYILRGTHFRWQRHRQNQRRKHRDRRGLELFHWHYGLWVMAYFSGVSYRLGQQNNRTFKQLTCLSLIFPCNQIELTVTIRSYFLLLYFLRFGWLNGNGLWGMCEIRFRDHLPRK